MCTINMTFNVPETAPFNIEALKQQMQAYFDHIISFPSVLKREDTAEDQFTQQMLNRFSGAWHGEESADEIIAKINESKDVREPLTF